MSSRPTVLVKTALVKTAVASFAVLLSLSVLRADPLGVLEIRSLPEVDVVWERVYLGKTDEDGLLAVEGIPHGDYSVTFRKTGYRDTGARIDVKPGEKTVFLLHMEIEPPAAAVLPESLAGPAWEANPTGAPTVPESPEDEASAPESPAPAPVRTAPVQPLGLRETAASDAQPASGSPWLLLAAALGGAALAFTIRRRHRRPESAPAPNATPPIMATEPMPKAGGTDRRRTDPAFLEDLKRREQALAPRAPLPAEGEIIDVEAIEVRPVEERP